ncbi:hypothetical protein DFP72DRAFT_911676 [Ephemerocybe angulata]|uniref:DUF6533 domain-containing protein n=1 Tax=Ephemerocybe angulata TaxID=980116 RepID=A0A8H6M2P3_9AGAR|nr:hypothetical protein DFP72DRAFT_911676 [Tulosesus angulatus]
MSLSPEELADLTLEIPIWTLQEYLSLALYSFYFYHFLTTLAEEVSTMWHQKRGTGKMLFFFNRYIPIAGIIQLILLEFRVHTVFTPKGCTALWIGTVVTAKATTIVSEVALLLCLHALLGASRRYLVLLLAVYTGLTLGGIIPQIGHGSEAASALPIDPIDEALGYACTWENGFTPAATAAYAAAGHVSLAKAVAISALALAIFFVRYRNKTGTLIHIVRRDSGVQILSLTAIRLGGAITAALQLKLGFYNIPVAIVDGLITVLVPILSCRLLLNMRKSGDPIVRTIVSTLLFDPPRPGEDSEDDFDDGDDTDVSASPIEKARFAGLGRKKATALGVKEKGDIEGGDGRSGNLDGIEYV